MFVDPFMSFLSNISIFVPYFLPIYEIKREAVLCDPSYGCCWGTKRVAFGIPFSAMSGDVGCCNARKGCFAQARDAALPFLDAVAACLEVRLKKINEKVSIPPKNDRYIVLVCPTIF